MQLSFDTKLPLPEGCYDYGARSSGEAHGVVLTKTHIVELILDLAGYTKDRKLHTLRLLDPACGKGAFVVAAVDRLMHATQRTDRTFANLGNAVLAYDTNPSLVDASRSAIAVVLERHCVPRILAAELAQHWIRKGDFLLAAASGDFDTVVGNPPYVRIEQLLPQLLAEYRTRYRSLYDRADLYVAFIERGLSLLADNGVLTFVCADRWTVNKYGGPLREIVTSNYALDAYVDLHTASPFQSDVVAYPSIFSIRRGKQGKVSVLKLETGSSSEAADVLPSIRRESSTHPRVALCSYDSWFQADEPWVISSPKHLEALRALEARCQPLEADGRTRVRIGVATGVDSVYIVQRELDVERDRLVPLVMREDLDKGNIRDAKRYVINTFQDDGGVIRLSDYPKLAKYLEAHSTLIKKRHVAQKNPTNWFRTIDRVYPRLVSVPKLLLPDIAGANQVVYDDGHFHPHHNLYFVTSDIWDMELLGGLLSSRVALFFVWSYAVKMRGGYLRFQAQYLRRIRVPQADTLPDALAKGIRAAFRKRDFAQLDALALKAYDIKDLPEFDFVDTRT